MIEMKNTSIGVIISILYTSFLFKYYFPIPTVNFLFVGPDDNCI